jgi:hypothetical protein
LAQLNNEKELIMAVNHNVVIARVKELREQYAEAQRRRDLEGFFSSIAIREAELSSVRTFKETCVEPLRKVA